MDKTLFTKIYSISDFLEWSIKNKNLLEPRAKQIFERYYSSYIKTFSSYIKKNYNLQTLEVCKYINKNVKILEIGAGCGTEAIWFAMQGAKVLSIDINQDRIFVANSRKKVIEEIIESKLDVEFKYCSIFDLKNEYHNGFDIIWMEQAFHHIEPRDDFFANPK